MRLPACRYYPQKVLQYFYGTCKKLLDKLNRYRYNLNQTVPVLN